jgi:hypothetical protein
LFNYDRCDNEWLEKRYEIGFRIKSTGKGKKPSQNVVDQHGFNADPDPGPAISI